jgi:hypothetical protein
MMQKCIVLGFLVSLSCAKNALACGAKALANASLTDKSEVLSGKQWDFGKWMVRDHPVLPFLLKKISLLESTQAVNGARSSSEKGLSVTGKVCSSKIQRFLVRKINERQALVLIGIYEVVIRGALSQREDSEVSSDINVEGLRFDFNRHSHLYEAFKTVPREIQDIFRPYVIAPTNSSQDDS